MLKNFFKELVELGVFELELFLEFKSLFALMVEQDSETNLYASPVASRKRTIDIFEIIWDNFHPTS